MSITPDKKDVFSDKMSITSETSDDFDSVSLISSLESLAGDIKEQSIEESKASE